MIRSLTRLFKRVVNRPKPLSEFEQGEQYAREQLLKGKSCDQLVRESYDPYGYNSFDAGVISVVDEEIAKGRTRY
jgi:hypothetical protein